MNWKTLKAMNQYFENYHNICLNQEFKKFRDGMILRIQRELGVFSTLIQTLREMDEESDFQPSYSSDIL